MTYQHVICGNQSVGLLQRNRGLRCNGTRQHRGGPVVESLRHQPGRRSDRQGNRLEVFKLAAARTGDEVGAFAPDNPGVFLELGQQRGREVFGLRLG